jgi:hypothetical protein
MEYWNDGMMEKKIRFYNQTIGFIEFLSVVFNPITQSIYPAWPVAIAFGGKCNLPHVMWKLLHRGAYFTGEPISPGPRKQLE